MFSTVSGRASLVRVSRAAVLAGILAGTVACTSSPGGASAPVIALRAPSDGSPAYVEVTGLSRDALRTLDDERTHDAWARVLRVAVDEGASPVLGQYDVTNDALRFTPLFPFDPGRPYHVRFDPSVLAGAQVPSATVVEATVGLPPRTAAPTTVVTAVYPSGDEIPENLLRMYVEFSAPMGRKSGVEHIALLDHAGREIEGAVLPLDYEFWSPDHTRFTVFFDPGRVKLGILPNAESGRPLETGRTVTLVVGRDWLDAQGLTLKQEFRRRFEVGAAADRPLDPASWQIEAPAAGSRGPVTVTFPEPLDRGLLTRALGIRRESQPVLGDITVARGETRWMFTPQDVWRPGAYQLLALDILEDPAGNQIGRAFEVANAGSVESGPEPETVTIPFRVR